jgi:hypothetical protein
MADRLPAFAGYPTRRAPQRLFALLPGQTGRYQANFRLISGTRPGGGDLRWSVRHLQPRSRCTVVGRHRPAKTTRPFVMSAVG